MKTNVNLEFINKVRELNKSMRDLAIFWDENENLLEDLNVSKDYPFNVSFDELTFDSHNWFLTLVNTYIEGDPNNLYTVFNEYLKNLK